MLDAIREDRDLAALEAYKFADASRALYDFAWDEFCSFYVEMAKGRLQNPQTKPVAQRVLAHPELKSTYAPTLRTAALRSWRPEQREFGTRARVWDRDRVVLIGNARVWQDDNVVSGDTITIYLSQDRSVVQGGRQERVKAVFYPREDGKKDGQPRRENPGGDHGRDRIGGVVEAIDEIEEDSQKDDSKNGDQEG